MDGNPERPPSATNGVGVPRHLAEILDQSAEDLRDGRVDDARETLARLQRKLDEHVAGESVTAEARAPG